MTTIKRKTFDELAAVLKDNWYSDTEHVWNSIVVDIANVLNTNCLTFKRDKFLSACGYQTMEQEFNAAEDKRMEALLAGTQDQGPWVTPRTLEQASTHLKLGSTSRTSPLEVNPDWVAWHNKMHELAAQMHKLEAEQPTPKSWDAAVDYVLQEDMARDLPKKAYTAPLGWDAIEADNPTDPTEFRK